MWSIFWFCIGMFFILSMFAGFVAYTTGNIAFPGTDRARVMRAKNNAKIAEFEADAAEKRFQTAQMQVNREQMLELHNLNLEKILEERLALGKGDEE